MRSISVSPDLSSLASRVSETVELLLRPGKAPTKDLGYHRLRILFSLEDDASEYDEVRTRRQTILALAAEQQPRAYLEAFRELLSNTLDSYLTQVSNRLGLVTKALSVIATISVPFVVVSGMWGMNFTQIPLSHTSHGFWTMLVVQLALGGLLLALLRWRKLL